MTGRPGLGVRRRKMAGLSRGCPEDIGHDLQGLGLRPRQVHSTSLNWLSLGGLGHSALH